MSATILETQVRPRAGGGSRAGGELLARYTGDSNSRSFVPFAGGILAEYYCGGVIFDHPDELGSAATATDCTGTNVQERLYDPQGQLNSFWNTSSGGWGFRYVLLGARPVAFDNQGANESFDHPNALGSISMVTQYNGAPLSDQQFYPWGTPWNIVNGTDENWASTNGAERFEGLASTPNRDYSLGEGRWLSPDPSGVKAVRLDDPQTWNMYAYARNNPTTLTDPTGLDFNLGCTTESDTCHNKQVGAWSTDENGNQSFTATVVTSVSLQDPNSGNTAVVNASGVQVTTAQGTFEGVFINGTPSASIQGDPKAAGWSDFTFNIFGSDVQHGNLDYGTATYKWSSNQSDVVTALSKMGPFSYPFENSVGNPKHPGDINFRFSTGEYPTLFNYGPSPHLLVPGDPRRTVPVGPGYVMGFHIDAQTGTVSHGACAWLDVGCQ